MTRGEAATATFLDAPGQLLGRVGGQDLEEGGSGREAGIAYQLTRGSDGREPVARLHDRNPVVPDQGADGRYRGHARGSRCTSEVHRLALLVNRDRGVEDDAQEKTHVQPTERPARIR